MMDAWRAFLYKKKNNTFCLLAELLKLTLTKVSGKQIGIKLGKRK